MTKKPPPHSDIKHSTHFDTQRSNSQQVKRLRLVELLNTQESSHSSGNVINNSQFPESSGKVPAFPDSASPMPPEPHGRVLTTAQTTDPTFSEPPNNLTTFQTVHSTASTASLLNLRPSQLFSAPFTSFPSATTPSGLTSPYPIPGHSSIKQSPDPPPHPEINAGNSIYEPSHMYARRVEATLNSHTTGLLPNRAFLEFDFAASTSQQTLWESKVNKISDKTAGVIQDNEFETSTGEFLHNLRDVNGNFVSPEVTTKAKTPQSHKSHPDSVHKVSSHTYPTRSIVKLTRDTAKFGKPVLYLLPRPSLARNPLLNKPNAQTPTNKFRLIQSIAAPPSDSQISVTPESTVMTAAPAAGSHTVNSTIFTPPLHIGNFSLAPMNHVDNRLQYGDAMPPNLASIQLSLPVPPLAKAKPNDNAFKSQKTGRVKKKSKYSKEQDELILNLKKRGKTWLEIAEAANIPNFLAARNRYQVLIGQQGGGSFSWDTESTLALQSLLDKGEKEKWRHIASELNRIISSGTDTDLGNMTQNRKFSDKDCRDLIRYPFWRDPDSFGISISYTGTPTTSSRNSPPSSINNGVSRSSVAQPLGSSVTSATPLYATGSLNSGFNGGNYQTAMPTQPTAQPTTYMPPQSQNRYMPHGYPQFYSSALPAAGPPATGGSAALPTIPTMPPGSAALPPSVSQGMKSQEAFQVFMDQKDGRRR